MRTKKPKENEKVYCFRVSLKEGRVNEFKNIWRDIEVLESHSLYNLANAITKAYGFYFDHCFGFYSDIDGPYFESEFHYDLFTDIDDLEPTGAKSVKKTKVKEAFKKEGDKLRFLFDYGDCWFFVVELIKIKNADLTKKYPVLTRSQGKAPEQYPPLEEDYDEEYNDEETEYDSSRRIHN